MADVSNITSGQAQATAVGGQLAMLGTQAGNKPRSLWSNAFRQFKKHRLAMGGVIVLIVLISATLIGPKIWPKSRTAIDFNSSLQDVSWTLDGSPSRLWPRRRTSS